MDKIQLWVDHLLETFGLVGDSVAYISHAVLALIAILLAVVAGLLCRRILVPIV
jgi:miniconductance mechanosensitive channel